MEKNITLTHREKTSIFRIIIKFLISGLVLSVLVLAGMLLVTKDSVQGDVIYPYKIQIENSALSLAKGTSFEEPLQKLILGRRLEERKP